jgi:hypothetical protein
MSPVGFILLQSCNMGLNWWIEDNKKTIIEWGDSMQGLGRFINIAIIIIIIIIIIINQEFSISNKDNLFCFINVGVRSSLRASQLIPRTLKLTIM